MNSKSVQPPHSAKRRGFQNMIPARSGLVLLCSAVLGAPAFGQQFANGNLNGFTGWSILDCAYGGGYDNTESHTIDGSGCVWLNNNGSANTIPRAEQELTGLTVGTDYTVDFWAKTGSIFDAGDPLRVQLDGVTVFTGPNMLLSTWDHLSFDFVAGNTSTLFSVQGEVLADSDYKVDDFHLGAPTPEPLSLLGLASFAGVTLLRRRRARS